MLDWKLYFAVFFFFLELLFYICRGHGKIRSQDSVIRSPCRLNQRTIIGVTPKRTEAVRGTLTPGIFHTFMNRDKVRETEVIVKGFNYSDLSHYS